MDLSLLDFLVLLSTKEAFLYERGGNYEALDESDLEGHARTGLSGVCSRGRHGGFSGCGRDAAVEWHNQQRVLENWFHYQLGSVISLRKVPVLNRLRSSPGCCDYEATCDVDDCGSDPEMWNLMVARVATLRTWTDSGGQDLIAYSPGLEMVAPAVVAAMPSLDAAVNNIFGRLGSFFRAA
jgi:hypothetical protein